jgi:hypothetical protein
MILFLLFALLTLALQICERNAAPDEQQWGEAQSIITSNFESGDIIRVSPNWADSARVGMYEYPFNLAAQAEEEELYPYERLWIISDAEHADEALDALPTDYEVTQSWEPNSHTVVILIDIPTREHVLFDFIDALPQAEMALVFEDRVESCNLFFADGWHCDPDDQWLHITPSYEETGASLHRCLYVGLPPEATLQLTYRGVPPGSRITGNVGNTMASVRADRGDDVHFSVTIGESVQHSSIIPKWDETFFPYELDTASLEETQQEVVFRFHTEDFFDRWLCFRGRVMR